MPTLAKVRPTKRSKALQRTRASSVVIAVSQLLCCPLLLMLIVFHGFDNSADEAPVKIRSAPGTLALLTIFSIGRAVMRDSFSSSAPSDMLQSRQLLSRALQASTRSHCLLRRRRPPVASASSGSAHFLTDSRNLFFDLLSDAGRRRHALFEQPQSRSAPSPAVSGLHFGVRGGEQMSL